LTRRRQQKRVLDSHTSFEDYKNDVGKLKKIAEQVAFTIIYQAIRYNRLEEYKKVILQLSTSNMERG
jgi:hypothetical protein